MKINYRRLTLFLFLFFLDPFVPGQGLPIAKPDEMGFSPTRLHRIKPFM
jgi:hypothetical protein